MRLREIVMSAILDIVRSAIVAEPGEGLMSKATSEVVTKDTMPSEDARQTLSKASAADFSVPPTSIHTVEADGVRVFYRAAGDTTAPVVLLLHGFPASSFMFRELIPRLADHYRVIAPDLPGFGFTGVPAERKYAYSFDALAVTIEAFTQALKIDRYALYVFDYGAPTGFRLAMAHPEWECVRRRSGRCLGSDPPVLGVAHGGKSRSTPQKYSDARRNTLAVHPRSYESGEHSARVVHARHGSSRTPG